MWETYVVYGIAALIGGLIGLKILRDRERGNVETLNNVPLFGKVTMVEYWWPRTNNEKNILIGKVLVFAWVAMAFYSGWVLMLFLALIPMLYHVEYFDGP